MRLLLFLLLLPSALAAPTVFFGEGDARTQAWMDTAGIEYANGTADGTLIVIGGPCANPAWKNFSTLTCNAWPYAEGEGTIRVVENAILIAGTTAEDTELLAREFFSADRLPPGDLFSISETTGRTLLVLDEFVSLSDAEMDRNDINRIVVNGRWYANVDLGETIDFNHSSIRLVEVEGRQATFRVEG